MTKKKGKLLTFCWSLIPGAGEMYLGFFKQGISLMAAFAVLLGISGFLQLSFLTFLSPIVWFYSFFHTNNLNSLSDEEFYSLEDDYLIHFSDISSNQDTVKKHFWNQCFVEAVFADVILVYHSGPVSDRRSG